MAKYTLHGFAQSGDARVHGWRAPDDCPFRCAATCDCRPVDVRLTNFADEFGEDWSTYPALRDWLARFAATPRWQHPYALMPGHPRPVAA